MTDLEVWDIVVWLVAGATLGGIVGIEREAAGQDAGFRTHLMVALGAALFGVISVAGFDSFVGPRGSTNVGIDVTRIASYVAPGVGFIGGGAILKHRGNVQGITTATSLWTAAAVGLACGVGFWLAAVVATGIAIVALAVLKPLSNWIQHRRHRPATLVVGVAVPGDATGVLREIESLGLPEIKTMKVTPESRGSTEITVEFWSSLDDVARGSLQSEFGPDRRDDIVHLSITT